jgi:hypothetical protein
MVNVPVLSKTMVLSSPILPKTYRLLPSIPSLAALAMAEMVTKGVAKPNSAGEVKISRAITSFTSLVSR